MYIEIRALRELAAKDDVVALAEYIRLGANPEATGEVFVTPLSLCAGAGAHCCVEFLVATGVALDAGDPPPVLAAALGGHAEVLAALVAAGASVDPGPHRDDELGPLAAAAACADTRAIRLLASVGGIVGSHPKTVEDSFQCAIELKGSNRLAVARVLVEEVLAHPDVYLGGGPAFRVVEFLKKEGKRSADPAIVELAARAKARLDAERSEVEAAEDAIVDDRVGDLLGLLQGVPGPRRQRVAGAAASIAVLARSALLKTLLRFKPVVDISDGIGRTPLMLAVKAGATQTVDALCEAGASVGHRDTEGHTALDYLTELKSQGHPLAHAAEWVLSTSSATRLAPQVPLSEAGPVASEAYSAAKERRLDELFRLVSSADGEQRRLAAGAAILADCENGGWTLAEGLLDVGADPAAKNSAGRDMLFEAVTMYDLPKSLLDRILAHKPDLHATDRAGVSVLEWARRTWPPGDERLLTLERVCP